MGCIEVWSIGIFDFAAAKDNGGWLFSARVSDKELIPERYFKCSLVEVHKFSLDWTRSFLRDLKLECDYFEVNHV